MTEQQLKQTPSAWRHCGHQVRMWRQEAASRPGRVRALEPEEVKEFAN
ncbi:hypothetical protein HRW13_12040 [Streptomyces lunaelactis]|nr:hypothetical protein [Streptomyces lunaelactis]NUK41600.1 hypothetical protein [Streptomyces lunaelactis]